MTHQRQGAHAQPRRVWHQLPDELVVRAESFYRDHCGTLNQSS